MLCDGYIKRAVDLKAGPLILDRPVVILPFQKDTPVEDNP